MRRALWVLRAVLVLSLAGGLCAIPRLAAASRGLSAHDCCSGPAKPRNRAVNARRDCCLRAPLPEKPAVKPSAESSALVPPDNAVASGFQFSFRFVQTQSSPPQEFVLPFNAERAPPAQSARS